MDLDDDYNIRTLRVSLYAAMRHVATENRFSRGSDDLVDTNLAANCRHFIALSSH